MEKLGAFSKNRGSDKKPAGKKSVDLNLSKIEKINDRFKNLYRLTKENKQYQNEKEYGYKNTGG